MGEEAAGRRMMTSLFEVLRTLRKDVGMGASDLANKMGIDLAVLNKLESGTLPTGELDLLISDIHEGGGHLEIVITHPFNPKPVTISTKLKINSDD